MSARSLNKAQLIGNLTRDPELRYTPQGTAVCTFGMATNRSWTTDSGEKREATEFHRIVSWNKLAELCSQLLQKGRKVFVEGRLSTRNWTSADGNQRTTTEIVIDDMILLDRKPLTQPAGQTQEPQVQKKDKEEDLKEIIIEEPQKETDQAAVDDSATDDTKKKKTKADDKKDNKKEEKEEEEKQEEKLSADDIPF